MKTSLKAQTKSYYADQLARIKNPKSEYAPTVLFNHESGKTNHLSLNDESATEIVKWLTEHYNIAGSNEVDLTRVKNDSNGNPRYVVRYDCLVNARESAGLTIDQKYARAISKSRAIGGRKFHNKQFAYGILFQSYNTSELIKSIIELQSK